MRSGSGRALAVGALVIPVLAVALPNPASAAESAVGGSGAEAFTASSRVVVGTTLRGRTIVAQRQGDPAAGRILLVIGQMHGNEPKGRAVVDAVRRGAVPAGVQVWSIRTVNPDGEARRTRLNSRRVDLNRNFPTGWKRGAVGAGGSAASERETRAVMAFISQLKPDAVMSFHQAGNTVMTECDPKAKPWGRRIGAIIGLPRQRTNCKADKGLYTGTLNDWYSARFPGWFATVELPATPRVTRSMIERSARSIVTVADALAQR
ncbi:MAG: M14 family zinc carboxypeptidase [Actinomycetes bacterium]